MRDEAADPGERALAQQAVEAYAQGRVEDAIGAAKRMLAHAPDDAAAHFLLGALHAEIGLLPRAIEEIGRAVALDPELDAARFQLGLLELQCDAVDRARAVWSPLADRGEDDAYAWFVRGLLDLAGGRSSECIAALRAGLERDDFDAALGEQMARVLQVVEGGSGDPLPPADAAPPQPGVDPGAVRKALLARYGLPESQD